MSEGRKMAGRRAMRCGFRAWVCALPLLMLAGCDWGTGTPAEDGARSGAVGEGAVSAATGRILVGGSSTVYPISHEAKAQFERRNPGVEILVSIQGTKGGITRYLDGGLDIVNASRAATADEDEKARAKGLDWTPLTVGYDGVTVVVNKTNTFVKALSVADLKRLFEPGSTVKTWKDLNPDWPDRKIRLYVPGEDSGTFDFFTEVINGEVDAQRKDVKSSEDDETLVKDVGGDPDGLGYFGFAYYNAHKADVRAVPIQPNAESQPVEPLLETLIARRYLPLGRPLYIYVKNNAMTRSEVAEFVDYYMSNIQELATLAGYVPPSDDDIAANRRAVSAMKSGSAASAAAN